MGVADPGDDARRAARAGDRAPCRRAVELAFDVGTEHRGEPSRVEAARRDDAVRGGEDLVDRSSEVLHAEERLAPPVDRRVPDRACRRRCARRRRGSTWRSRRRRRSATLVRAMRAAERHPWPHAWSPTAAGRVVGSARSSAARTVPPAAAVTSASRSTHASQPSPLAPADVRGRAARARSDPPHARGRPRCPADVGLDRPAGGRGCRVEPPVGSASGTAARGARRKSAEVPGPSIPGRRRRPVRASRRAWSVVVPFGFFVVGVVGVVGCRASGRGRGRRSGGGA